MDQIVVGCVQLKIRLPQDRAELQEYLLRFVRTAQTKRVRLLVFPQLTGLMAAALATRDTRTGLLKQADRARRANTSFWTRAQARLAGSAASVLRADFSKALTGALVGRPDEVWQSYASLFGDIARHHAMTIVAGSAYLVDPTDGVVRHMALVFGPDGQLLGQQAAVTLPANEYPLVETGKRWQVIQTPVGRLGILLGGDLFYPEAGRMLAYGGAEALIGLGGGTQPVQYQRQRQGLLARIEDNQLYGALSFPVGYNPFTPSNTLPYVGRSMLAAPISMTPRFNGILVEMGTDSTEGLITAEWSYSGLRDAWSRDETPLRSAMPIDVTGPTLAAIYGRKLTIDQALRVAEIEYAPPALPEPPRQAGSGGPASGEAAAGGAVTPLPGEGDTSLASNQGEAVGDVALGEAAPGGEVVPPSPDEPEDLSATEPAEPGLSSHRWPWSR